MNPLQRPDATALGFCVKILQMKTCPRCDSTNVVRVLTSSMVLAVPELRTEVKEGHAVVCGACCGTGSSRTFRCKDCKLQWDEVMEEDIRGARE